MARKTNAPEQRANIAPPPEPSPPPKPKVEPLPQRPQQASAPAPTPGKTMKAQTKFVILSRQPQQLVKLAPKVTPVEPMHLLQPATFLENSLGEVPPQVKTKDLKVVVKKQPPRKLKKRKSPEPENVSGFVKLFIYLQFNSLIRVLHTLTLRHVIVSE